LIGVLLGGLIAALSRGPWVGAAAGVFAAMALGPGGVKRAIKLIMLGTVGFGVVLLTPYGAKVIDLLPFVGTVEPGSVEYRQRLFEVSMIVFWESPIFGLPDYLLHPAMEEMRQGQGIIDVVNTYLGIALYSGAVGLFLFIAPFLCAGFLVWRSLRKPGTREEPRQGVGRALLGALVGAAITIATVSSITVIPAFYWLLLALCVTFVRLMQAEPAGSQPQTAYGREASSVGRTYAYPGAFPQPGTS
jgi:O-antigen ligase